MENKVYPAFYESQDGSVYLYQNKNSYYSYIREEWDKSSPSDAHGLDKNITAEYLANTYGEVKSKEHAEFIVKLAKVNGFRLCNPEKTDKKWFCFDDNELYLFDDVEDASDLDEKQITIPLPPECESGPFKNIDADNIETMKFDIFNKMEKSTSTFKPTKITFNVPNGLDISFDTIEQGVLGSDERHLIINVTDNRVYEYDTVDERPKAGDNVRYKDAPWKVASLYKHVALLTHDDAMFEIANISELEKPKTPEQELRDELVEFIDRNDSVWKGENHYNPVPVTVHEFIADAILSKYNITKKGEGDE